LPFNIMLVLLLKNAVAFCNLSAIVESQSRGSMLELCKKYKVFNGEQTPPLNTSFKVRGVVEFSALSTWWTSNRFFNPHFVESIDQIFFNCISADVLFGQARASHFSSK